MIQNIDESTIDTENNINNVKNIKNKAKIFINVFSIKNIVIYIISLMVSMVTISGDGSPFSISILGACFANSIPALGVVIASVIGIIIKSGLEGAVSYILTALLIIATMFIIKPRNNEEENNERIKLSKNIFISTLIIHLAKIGISGFTLYDVLSVIAFSIIAVVFYKIFVNSVSVISDFREHKAFSIEEVLGASLLLSIAVTSFGDTSILGFSIRNILSILIVLILGWKNGVLVGTTAGVTIGVTMGVITSSEPVMVAAYAISGMIAGILNKFGKLGVIVGFCLGNIVLAYVSNGYTVELIHFKEILIASVGLLVIPKSVQINIEEFLGNSKFLPTSREGSLNRSKETADRLNNVSQTIKDMANNFKIQRNEVRENLGKTNKEIFINELSSNLSGYQDNMLYDDIAKMDGKIVEEIFKFLLDKQEINKESLLQIFADCNSYIVGFDDNNISQYLDENIMQMVRVINMSYKISKSNFVWQKKLEENKKNMETQLEGVSKAISDIARDIEKDVKEEDKYLTEKKEIIELLRERDIEIQEISIRRETRFLIELYTEMTNNVNIEYIQKILSKVLKENIIFYRESSLGTRLNFLSDDKFEMAIGSTEAVKNGSEISGDSILNIRLKDGKYLVALSDGMGSGKEAKESSEKALKMLENLLLSGFDRKTSIELINSSLINQNDEMFSTLDIAIVDLYAGNIEFIKRGASPTYIKNGRRVQIIQASSLPAGIINTNTLKVIDMDITSGDIMCMCSDGILDSNIEYKNKELWVKYLLEDIETTNTKKIADIVLNESIDNNYGLPKDDMSIVVCKFLEKK